MYSSIQAASAVVLSVFMIYVVFTLENERLVLCFFGLRTVCFNFLSRFSKNQCRILKNGINGLGQNLVATLLSASVGYCERFLAS